MAMEAVDARLVRREHRLIQLLDPPFDRSPQDPGYIRGYVPGVRENGGQYTHSAIWAAMAFAALGDPERAWELTAMINPANHARTAEEVATYKVEPYVVAADVYAREPHVGRGGWTWYTGSAGWMYRLIVESLLGVTLENGRLRVAPCLPAEWTGFKVRYRYRGTTYEIVAQQSPPGAVTGVPFGGGDARWRRAKRRLDSPRGRWPGASRPSRHAHCVQVSGVVLVRHDLGAKSSPRKAPRSTYRHCRDP
jgi:cellobiose phosphorylase